MKSLSKVATAAIVIGVLTGFVAVPVALGDGYPDAWNSLDVAGLTNLANQYKDQGAAGVENSKLLAGYVAAKYTIDSAAGNVVWNDWLEMATVLGRYVPVATQTAMAQGLQQALTPNAATTAALEADKLIEVGKCLTVLGQASAGGSVSTIWITGSDKYKSVTGTQALWLSGLLQAAGEAGNAARQRMVGHMTDTYQSDKAKMKAEHAEVWNSFARVYAKDLSAESKAQWVTKLRTAYGEKEMNGYEYKYLCRAMRGLGDTDVAGFSVAWMNSYENSWQSWTAKRGLADLASNLRSTAAAATTARAKVLTQVTAKYLSADQAATQSVPPLYWRIFVKAFGGDLSAESKAQWAGKLRTAFAAKEMGLYELRNMTIALRSLGDTDVCGFASGWVKDQNCWQSWEARELSVLLRSLRDSSESAKQARLKVADRVATRFLTDNATTKSVSCTQWMTFAIAFGGDLSSEIGAEWAGKLLAAFANGPDAIKALDSKDALHLATAVHHLGSRTEASSLALSWLTGSDSATRATAVPRDLINLAGLSVSWEKTALSQRMSQLEEAWLAKDQQKPLSWQEYFYVARAWKRVGNTSKAQAWAMKGYQRTVGTEEARASADKWTLLGIGELLKLADLTGQGKGYEAYATALVGLVKQGKLPSDRPWYYYYYWGAPLGTAETRQVVQAELTDSEGQPRPAAVKVLSFAYRASGELKIWKSFLDGKITAPEITGDTKARWLMAQAFAESISEGVMDALGGKKWLEQAVAAATSKTCQFQAVRQLVGAYCDVGRHETARQILDSVAGQFAGTPVASDVESLRLGIDRAKEEYAAARVLFKAQAARQAAELRLRQMESRLEEARQRNDQEQIARLEALLLKLQE